MNKLAMLLVLALSVTANATQNVRLSWNLSTSAGVTGQRLYCSPVSGSHYTQKWPATGWGPATTKTVLLPFFKVGDHYCVATAYDATDNKQSVYSNEVHFTTTQ